jgi:hypothetical protein
VSPCGRSGRSCLGRSERPSNRSPRSRTESPATFPGKAFAGAETGRRQHPEMPLWSTQRSKPRLLSETKPRELRTLSARLGETEIIPSAWWCTQSTANGSPPEFPASSETSRDKSATPGPSRSFSLSENAALTVTCIEVPGKAEQGISQAQQGACSE